MCQQTATRSSGVGWLDHEGCDFSFPPAITRPLGLQTNTVIRNCDRDRVVIGRKRYPNGKTAMQIAAAPMTSRVAERFLGCAQQQIGNDGSERIGSGTRIIRRIECQFIECSAKLAIESGAQSAHQSAFEVTLVRYRRGAHQRRQIMVRLPQLAHDGLQLG